MPVREKRVPRRLGQGAVEAFRLVMGVDDEDRDGRAISVIFLRSGHRRRARPACHL